MDAWWRRCLGRWRCKNACSRRRASTSMASRRARAAARRCAICSAANAGTLAGVELKALASSSNHIGELTWAAKPDAGINSIKDLVGKKVAYTSPKSITEMVIRTALKQEGLAGKVDILPLGGLGPALTALAQGAVAAAPLNDPALTVTPDKYK